MKPVWSFAPPRHRPRRIARKVASRNGALHYLPGSMARDSLFAKTDHEFWVLTRRRNLRPASTFGAGMLAFEYVDRTVARTVFVPRRVMVSTVFLGLDHNHCRHYGEPAAPVLFETLVFGGGALDGETTRYYTLDEARKGHDQCVKRVQDVIRLAHEILEDGKRSELSGA